MDAPGKAKGPRGLRGLGSLFVGEANQGVFLIQVAGHQDAMSARGVEQGSQLPGTALEVGVVGGADPVGGVAPVELAMQFDALLDLGRVNFGDDALRDVDEKGVEEGIHGEERSASILP